MSLDIGTLAGFLDLDTGPFDRALGDVEGKWGKVSAGAAVAGAAAGALLAKGISDAISIDAANDKLQAQLGLTAEEAQRYGEISGNLFGQGWGASMEEVHEALGSVQSSLGEFVGQSDEALEGATRKAMALAETFGVDVTDATAMVGYTMQAGLARDTDHAFDLIARSMQRMPAAMRGELIPIIEEYGVHLAAMGFEGEEAFNLLVNASQDGSFALDKTADAIKELSIRSSDMSATTIESFEAAGLNADEMAARFLEGGDSARGALDDLIEGLLAIEDPVARSNAAIALMGGPLEDMSTTEIPQFLEGLRNTTDTLGEVEGTMDDVASALEDNLGRKLESVKRQAALFVVDFLESPFGPWVAGAGALAIGTLALIGPMQTLADNARSVQATLKTAIDRMGGLGSAAALAAGAAGIGAVGAAIHELRQARISADIDQLADEFLAGADAAEQLQTVLSEGNVGPFSTGGDLSRFFGEFETLLDTSTESATRWVDQLERAGALSPEHIEAFREAIEDQASANRQAAQDTEASTDAIEAQEEATVGATQATEDQVEALQELSDALNAQFDPVFAMSDAMTASRDARNQVTEAEMALAEAVRLHGSDSLEAMAAQEALTDAQLGAVEAAVGLESAEIALAQAIANGDVEASELTRRLDEWVEQGIITRAEADLLTERYGIMEGQVRDTTGALGELDQADARPDAHLDDHASEGINKVGRRLEGLDGRQARVSVTATVSQTSRRIADLLGFDEGGIVPGPRGAPRLVLAHGGEVIVPMHNQAAMANFAPRMSAAGAAVPAGAGGGGTVRIDLSGVDDQFARWFRRRVWADGGGDVQVAFGRSR